MTLILTFVMASLACIFLITMLVWSKKGPAFRMSEEDALRIIEWVLLGQATENEWTLFCELPIRHDEGLERLRLSCLLIEEQFALRSPSNSYLLTLEGREKLEEVYQKFKSDKH